MYVCVYVCGLPFGTDSVTRCTYPLILQHFALIKWRTFYIC